PRRDRRPARRRALRGRTARAPGRLEAPRAPLSLGRALEVRPTGRPGLRRRGDPPRRGLASPAPNYREDQPDAAEEGDREAEADAGAERAFEGFGPVDLED